jgi:thioredoxin-dependent peroxiredoxin
MGGRSGNIPEPRPLPFPKLTMTMKPNRLATLFTAVLLAATPLRAEPPKDFTLPAVKGGSEFKLSEAKGSYVALHFLLKTECPFCLRHTHTYLKRMGELPGVKQVFIKPDSVEDIQKWAKDIPDDSPIYRDAGATIAKAYGIPDGYKFHGEMVHFPALVLLDPSGKEVFRYVGKSNSERYSFDDLKAKIAELKK